MKRFTSKIETELTDKFFALCELDPYAQETLDVLWEQHDGLRALAEKLKGYPQNPNARCLLAGLDEKCEYLCQQAEIGW